MKLWIDDIRPAPAGYFWAKSVNEAKAIILDSEEQAAIPRMYNCDFRIKLIDIDHDAGDYVYDGGDYIKLLDWLEEFGYDGYIHIHSMNPVGAENMRRIIQRNGWREI